MTIIKIERAVYHGTSAIPASRDSARTPAIASLDALEKIASAVGDKTIVTFDSGIRGASDVFKALALGAKFVWVGRLWVWGLSSDGEHGVRHVMRALLAELDIPASGISRSEGRMGLPKGRYTISLPDDLSAPSTMMMLFYSAQIHLRKVINRVHTDLYKVEKQGQTRWSSNVQEALSMNLNLWRNSLP